MAWTTVLTKPGAFFDERQDDPRLLGPAVVVLVIGVLGLLSTIPGLLLVLESVPAEARPILGAGLAIGVLFGLVAPFAVWLLYAIVFYGLSIPLGGAGSFRDLFAFTGWGFLPRIIGAAVSVVVVFVAIGSVPPPESAEAMAGFQTQLQSHPLVRASSVLGLLITLWSAYIWTHAVATARALSPRAAALTVSLPVLVSVAWTLAQLLGIPVF